jgi:cell division protein FtsB
VKKKDFNSGMPMQGKQFLLRLFFGAEIVIFSILYLFGAQGLQVVMAMRKDNGSLSLEVRELESEVGKLNKNLVAWNNDPFYKEKIAREQLHMAKPQDEIYFTD